VFGETTAGTTQRSTAVVDGLLGLTVVALETIVLH
jgi:hypothetical protein